MGLVLVGLPGAGKSTVGRQLARRLGLPFSDTDQLIEHQIGCAIRAYFEAEGETAFRNVEQKVLADLDIGGAGVFATGGGIVLRDVNRQVLSTKGVTVIYLRASVDELFRRLAHDTQRPLMQTTDPMQVLKELHNRRDPLYRVLAHLTVDSGRVSTGQLVNSILAQLAKAP